MRCPRRTPLENVAYTCMLSILSTSFTSVSIYSVCCYSSVSISVGHTRWVERGVGGSIFWKTSDTALCSTYVSTLWSTYYKEVRICRLGLWGCVEYWYQVHIRAVQLRGRNAENRIKITLDDRRKETKCRKDSITRFTNRQFDPVLRVLCLSRIRIVLPGRSPCRVVVAVRNHTISNARPPVEHSHPDGVAGQTTLIVVITCPPIISGSDETIVADTNFFHPGSWIRNKESKYFNPKIVSKLMKYDSDCSSRILIFYPSRIPGSKRHRIPDPRSATLDETDPLTILKTLPHG